MIKLDKKLKKPKNNCGLCNRDLKIQCGDILYYNKVSDDWICEDCFGDKISPELLIFFKYRNDGMAEMIRTRELEAGGPFEDELPGFSVDAFLNQFSDKCDHSEKYYDEKSIIFRCEDCRIWICGLCLDRHDKHSITVNIGAENNEYLIQVLPFLNNPLTSTEEIIITKNTLKKNLKDTNTLNLEICNLSKYSIYDITLSLGYSNVLNNIPSIEYHDFGTINEIKPSSSKFFEIKSYDLRGNPISLYIIYRDYFDGVGVKEIRLADL